MTATAGAANRLRDRLISALRANADPERAAWDKRYHKSPWEHWGVSTPKMQAALRESLAEALPLSLFALSRDLWREQVWDLKIAALRILAQKSVPPDGRLWRFVTARMGDLDAWAVADNMADSARAVSSPIPAGSTSSRPGSTAHICGPAAPVWSSRCPGRKRDAIPSACSPGRAPRPRPRMVYPKGDRLVAAGIEQARPRPRASVPRRARGGADERSEARGAEIFVTPR